MALHRLTTTGRTAAADHLSHSSTFEHCASTRQSAPIWVYFACTEPIFLPDWQLNSIKASSSPNHRSHSVNSYLSLDQHPTRLVPALLLYNTGLNYFRFAEEAHNLAHSTNALNLLAFPVSSVERKVVFVLWTNRRRLIRLHIYWHFALCLPPSLVLVIGQHRYCRAFFLWKWFCSML